MKKQHSKEFHERKNQSVKSQQSTSDELFDKSMQRIDSHIDNMTHIKASLNNLNDHIIYSTITIIISFMISFAFSISIKTAIQHNSLANNQAKIEQMRQSNAHLLAEIKEAISYLKGEQ